MHNAEMLMTKEAICQTLHIGERRFRKWYKGATPPMPVRFDGYSYIADATKLIEWHKEFTASGCMVTK